jgi:two-component system chemotaxis sensor kinase CheA
MDIVRTNVAKLKGLIEIDSQIGRGTVLTLKLPLTLAIIQGLLVKSSGEIFAIPLSSVVEVVRVRSTELGTIGGRTVMRLRNSVLAVGRMSDVLGLSEHQPPPEWSYVVVVSWSEQRLGIVVDAFLGQKEIVIKSIGNPLESVPAIGGSTILGDGRVVLILDVGQFVSIFEGQESRMKEYGPNELSHAQ